MRFVVRLFPEISIKSAPVRKRWTKMLTDNLRLMAKRIHPTARVNKEWDRIEVTAKVDDPAVEGQLIDMLARTPGIANFSHVQTHPFESLHDIYELVQASWGDQLKGKTFCVRVKRTGNHDFTSTEVERYVGGGLNQNNPTGGVKLKDPDVSIGLEVKDDQVYLVTKKYQGLGGFPMGTQESVLSLISGGYDSTVASFQMIKRGLRTHYCFFNLGGREHELAVKEIAFFLWNRFGSTHRVRFISVPFEGVVGEILQKVGPSNMGVVLKRMMLRAGERIAERGGIEAMVTGEAVAQVSSQTIPNLSVIDSVTDMMVLRPLIVMDKRDIIDISRKIGAEEFSAAVPEYCGVISVKPSAKVNRAKLEAEEEKFDFSILEHALENAVVQSIDEVMDDAQELAEVELVSELPVNAKVIDIRHHTEQELRPLTVEGREVLEIPFYQLSTAYAELDKAVNYYLFCDKGVMSGLHARHLLDAGYTNVGVYRP